MSFFDTLSNFVDGVCSFVLNVTESVKNFFEEVTPKVAEFVSKLGPVINVICIATTVAAMILFPELDIIGLVIAIGEICALVTEIAEATSDKPTGLDAVDLAMRAENCDEKPEDFDSYNDYIDHLAKNIKADKEKMENLSNSERMAYSLAGLAIREQQISQNLGADVPAETYVDAYKAQMSAVELKNMIETYAENETEMPRLGDYLKGDKLEKEEQTQMRSGLYEAIKDANPEMTDSEIQEKIFDMKENYSTGIEG